MKKVIGFLISLVFCAPPFAYAEGESLRNVTQVEGMVRREGDNRVALAVIVGSTTARSPYSSINWGDGVNGQRDNFRSITVQNTSAFDVLCATYSTFVGHGPRWVIPASTGSFTSYNYATFYMVVSPGVSSQTVAGVVERKSN